MLLLCRYPSPLSFQVLFNVAMVEVHEGNKLSAEDTLHQALPDADLGQSKTIHKALHMLQVCKTLDRVKLYTRYIICYRYVRP